MIRDDAWSDMTSERNVRNIFRGVEQLIATAANNPECFKCQQPITELSDVRIITVRVDGERKDVWCHAAHSEPGA